MCSGEHAPADPLQVIGEVLSLDRFHHEWNRYPYFSTPSWRWPKEIGHWYQPVRPAEMCPHASHLSPGAPRMYYIYPDQAESCGWTSPERWYLLQLKARAW